MFKRLLKIQNLQPTNPLWLLPPLIGLVLMQLVSGVFIYTTHPLLWCIASITLLALMVGTTFVWFQYKGGYQELKCQQEYLQGIITHSNSGYALVAKNRQDILYTSPRLCEIIGYDPKPGGVERLYSTLFPDQCLCGHIKQRIKTDINTGDSSKWHWMELPATVNGKEVFLNVTGTFLPTQTSYVIAIQDVTEQVLTRNSKELESNLNKQFLNEVDVGIVVLSADLAFLRWNPTMERITGIKAEDALGKYALEVTPELVNTPLLEAWSKVLHGESVTVEFRRPTGDGSQHWLVNHCSPLRDRTGVVTGIMGIVRDVTAHKLLEEGLRQSQKMEAVGQLAGGIAHDYNNILTGQMMCLEIARETVQDGDTKRMLMDAEALALRAAKLTKQLLLFSRRQAMDAQIMPLNDNLEQTMGMLRRMLPPNIKITINYGAKDAIILGDETMIAQVIMNLVLNAKDAMDNGGEICVSIQEVAFTRKNTQMPAAVVGDFLRLRVKDSGTGMSHETLQHLFEPFFTTKQQGKGTGLGLAIVHGVVKKHQGWVHVTSVVGSGASFDVYLPKYKCPITERRIKPELAVPFSGGKILLVEDEELIRCATATALRKAGYTVFDAESGEEGLRLWEANPAINLIVTDMVMPGISGQEMLNRIRCNQPQIPAIIASGYCPDLSSDEKLGARTSLLHKPFLSSKMLRTVAEVLNTTNQPVAVNRDCLSV